jgi:hypothetical protein
MLGKFYSIELHPWPQFLFLYYTIFWLLQKTDLFCHFHFRKSDWTRVILVKCITIDTLVLMSWRTMAEASFWFNLQHRFYASWMHKNLNFTFAVTTVQWRQIVQTLFIKSSEQSGLMAWPLSMWNRPNELQHMYLISFILFISRLLSNSSRSFWILIQLLNVLICPTKLVSSANLIKIHSGSSP